MEFTVQQIADLLGGEVQGKPDECIRTVAKIQEGVPGAVAFLSNPKYEPYLYNTGASAVIVNRDLRLKQAVQATLIRVDDAYTSFSVLLDTYQRLTTLSRTGVEEPSYCGQGVEIGEDVYRGAFSYIGDNTKVGNNVKIYPHVFVGENVHLGDNTILYPGVKICRDTVVGKYCTFQAGAVVGSDGFGFAPQADGSYKTIPQVGRVVIGDHVDVGANTVIDRATMGDTRVEKGVKLDNLIQVAHNVEIGAHTVVAAQAGISGSSRIGEYCMVGGQVGVSGHIAIADGVKIAAQSGLMRSVDTPDTSLIGSPVLEKRDFFRVYTVFRKLPALQRRVEELEEKVINLLHSAG